METFTEHVTEARTLCIQMDDVDCERMWNTEDISKVTFAREKVVSAKNGSPLHDSPYRSQVTHINAPAPEK